MLRRHSSGPVNQVNGYVGECLLLNPTLVAEEYRRRVASAPTRSSRYIVEHDTSGRKAGSGRREELLAHRMFEAGSKLRFSDWEPISVVDFQTPLKAVQSDRLGKVDLLGVGRGLCVIELKVLNSSGTSDTPLNALLEAVGYCAVIEANAAVIKDELDTAGRPVGSGPVSALVLAPIEYWERWDHTRAIVDWRSALRTAASTLSAATRLDIGLGLFDSLKISSTIDVEDVLA